MFDDTANSSFPLKGEACAGDRSPVPSSRGGARAPDPLRHEGRRARHWVPVPANPGPPSRPSERSRVLTPGQAGASVLRALRRDPESPAGLCPPASSEGWWNPRDQPRSPRPRDRTSPDPRAPGTGPALIPEPRDQPRSPRPRDRTSPDPRAPGTSPDPRAPGTSPDPRAPGAGPAPIPAPPGQDQP